MSLCAVYEIRCNEDMFTKEDLIKWCQDIAKHWVFQLEEGESGYRHWQGRISLRKKQRKPALMKWLESKDLPVPNYLEPTTNKEHQKVAFYVQKLQTRIDGPYTDKDAPPAYVPKQYRNITLFDWQKELMEVKDPTDRTCNLMINHKGGLGKSTLVRYCMLNHNSIKLPVHNDGIKLIQSCCCQLMGKRNRNPGHIFIDLPRAYDNQRIEGLFTAIEEIKSGYVYDERNTYKDWWFDTPQIWVFTNNDIDMNKLSLDRWILWNVENDKLIKVSHDAMSTSGPEGPTDIASSITECMIKDDLDSDNDEKGIISMPDFNLGYLSFD